MPRSRVISRYCFSFLIFLSLSLVILDIEPSIISQNSHTTDFDNAKQNGIPIEKVNSLKIVDIQQTSPQFGSELFDNPMSHDDDTRVSAVRFSPEGTTLASSGWDNKIKFWDVALGQEKELILERPDRIGALVYFPDGQHIATTDFDASLVFWDTDTGQVFWNCTNIGMQYQESSIAISPRGKKIAICANSYLKILNTETKVIQVLPESLGPNTVSFSPDGQILASGHSSSSIKLWNASTGELIQSFTNHEDAVYSLDFSPDGQFLISGCRDGSIKLWNMTSREEIMTLTEHIGMIWSLRFSPQGAIFASGGEDGIINLWNVSTGNIITSLTGHTDDVYSLDYSPDGTILASGSEDSSIKLWNMVNGGEVQLLDDHSMNVNSLTFADNGSILVSGGNDNVLIWDLTDNSSTIPSEYTFFDHDGYISSVTFSQTNSMFASAGEDKLIYVWDKTNRSILYNLTGHIDPVTSVVFSVNGSYLASSSGNLIKVWNMSNSGQFLFNLNGHTSTMNSLAFSSTDNLLASASNDRSIKLWNVTSGQLIDTLNDHISGVTSITFSPDGKYLASGSRDLTVNLWDIESKLPIVTFTYHTDVILSVDFSPNGNILASSDYGGTIYFWDLTTKKAIFSFPSELEPINSIVFSPSGRKLASTVGNLIKLWTISPIPKDIDNDGMPDVWEMENELDRNNYWDKFTDPDNDGLINSLEYFLGTNASRSDTDGDTMLDGWEYLMGLNPLLNDSYNDQDEDGMPNYWEHQMGLHPEINDASEDLDQDGMPNIWEFLFDLNASNPQDASLDLDGDWISNREEFRGGSNPRNFWSVPLFSLSILHFGGAAIILISGLILGWILITIQRKSLITEFEVPNYKMALKVKKSGFHNYSAYLRNEIYAKELKFQAIEAYNLANFTNATLQFENALKLFQRLENPPLIAESLYNLCHIQMDMGILKSESAIVNDILSLESYQDPLVSTFFYMSQGLLAEIEKDLRMAEKAWQSAINLDQSSEYYYNICLGSLIELEVKKWLNNPTQLMSEELRGQLNSLENLYGFKYNRLCSFYLLRARVNLASFLFDEVEEWFDKCQKVADVNNIAFYQAVVQKERERFQQYKNQIAIILETEKAVPEEKKLEMMKGYLQEAMNVVQEIGMEDLD